MELKNTVYLDYNATTPLDPGVREAMLPFFGPIFGNPSSVHHIGRQARALLDDARERVATVWACKPSEVIFTSGGTESDNLAIFGVTRLLRSKGRHLITSQIEHPAVMQCFDYLEKRESYSVTRLPVNSYGIVNPSDLAHAIRPDSVLVSIMAANNEIGSIQPVAEIGSICREKKVLFHTDAVQWFGKEPFSNIHQFNADMVSVCAHKLHGPRGVGALFVRSPLLPDPIIFGGSQENERRAGTENLPAIVGFAEVMERFVRNPVFPRENLVVLSSHLISFLEQLPGVTLLGSKENRLPNTVAFTVQGADSLALLAGLDLERICASSGSACSAGSIEPSHVLRALGQESQAGLIRFSLGRETTLQEVEYAEKVLSDVIKRVRCL